MAYTDIDKPSDYFNTKLYTGNGSTNAVTGVGFEPSFTWIKYRNSGTYGHDLYDAVRGATKTLNTNNTVAEYTSADRLTSFDSDGFSLDSNVSVNENTGTYVSWNWKAGTSFTNDASATGIGTIDSTGSVNQDAGFSIISYTGTGSVGTVAHNLGAKPNVMIQKKLSGSGAWIVYHDKVATNPSHKYLYLNSTAAVDDYADHFNDTEPTSSVFTLGTDSSVNGSGATNIMYCFTEKKGYSKFSSYIGNGAASDGTFVYTGFKPAFIILKSTGVNDWRIIDNKRSSSGGSNPVDKYLYAQSAAAEGASSTNGVPDQIDFLSNGFKIRQASAGINGSGQEYIFMCFAENPFVASTGVPATAR